MQCKHSAQYNYDCYEIFQCSAWQSVIAVQVNNLIVVPRSEPMFKTACPQMLKSGQKLTKIGQKMSKMIQIWSKKYKN